MDFLTQLINQRDTLQKQLDAINILIQSIDGRPVNAPNVSTAPKLAHEGIVEGKRGDCTTSFISVSGETEFKPASFDSV